MSSSELRGATDLQLCKDDMDEEVIKQQIVINICQIYCYVNNTINKKFDIYCSMLLNFPNVV